MLLCIVLSSDEKCPQLSWFGAFACERLEFATMRSACLSGSGGADALDRVLVHDPDAVFSHADQYMPQVVQCTLLGPRAECFNLLYAFS